MTDRFRDIRISVEHAKNLGISDPALRREAIINAVSAQKKDILQITEDQAAKFPSIAKRDIREESSEVIDTALRKYIYLKEGLFRVPVLIDAVHDKKPVPWEGNSKDFDEHTGKIATRVAELTGSSLIIGKKSRMRADLNRAWWTRKERNGFMPKEYPRSARAALFWAVRNVLINSNRLDEKEVLKDNFYRISIHGMKNNDDYDFAIAGSRRPADPELLEWFNKEFKVSLSEVGIEPKVVIALSGDKKTGIYSGPVSLRYFREAPEEDYLVQHPDFGLKFQTIQLEIANKIRKDPEKREAVSLALANVIKKMR